MLQTGGVNVGSCRDLTDVLSGKMVVQNQALPHFQNTCSVQKQCVSLLQEKSRTLRRGPICLDTHSSAQCEFP